MTFIQRLKYKILQWWPMHIIQELPADENQEFSEKYRK